MTEIFGFARKGGGVIQILIFWVLTPFRAIFLHPCSEVSEKYTVSIFREHIWFMLVSKSSEGGIQAPCMRCPRY